MPAHKCVHGWGGWVLGRYGDCFLFPPTKWLLDWLLGIQNTKKKRKIKIMTSKKIKNDSEWVSASSAISNLPTYNQPVNHTNQPTTQSTHHLLGVSYRIVSRIISYRVCIESYRIRIVSNLCTLCMVATMNFLVFLKIKPPLKIVILQFFKIKTPLNKRFVNLPRPFFFFYFYF